MTLKTKPILFSGEMVRAILDGRKTQTRRLVKPAPQMVTDNSIVPWDGDPEALIQLLNDNKRGCPYGQPGDLLWVREGFRSRRVDKEPGPVVYKADHPGVKSVPNSYGRPWKPSIHMPRWASRLTLRIKSVRVERLQDISEEDAAAEGVAIPPPHIGVNIEDGSPIESEFINWAPTDFFKEIWEGINGPESWADNPWVWAIEFEPILENVNTVMEREQ